MEDLKLSLDDFGDAFGEVAATESEDDATRRKEVSSKRRPDDGSGYEDSEMLLRDRKGSYSLNVLSVQSSDRDSSISSEIDVSFLSQSVALSWGESGESARSERKKNSTK